ncbi:carboxymuconolactone decarboxylase family protein [Kushneria phosphatilytica]|uniref:Carboxymuconolactone decarboxylase family protein n=1 Tax=Kushneria phosphatilytica TaxID=657387 RepID=A0A1S1NX12_9GAMM|nr:carboxymuconolactone decarboxylase family protein [Kushneria phosphatilytica]OHV12796.1 4-carboxymuconolactone decarboxylase [Kushneria phosphatilytica]QEL10645.1 carboxymuconolactone decarboxylase family protein [Kushneria phosphatilytica]
MLTRYLCTLPLLGVLAACSQMPDSRATRDFSPAPSESEMNRVSPAFAHYTNEMVLGELWHRAGLSPRDRSLVTLSALITQQQVAELPYHFNLALDNGVTPNELSEIITHLAFYTGWGNATTAVAILEDVFATRGIDNSSAPAVPTQRLPLDEKAEAKRQQLVAERFGAVAPGVVEYTTDALFQDLWLRPGLAPRDRSLVTVSALVAAGQPEQVTFHLNRAMDNGLSRAEASETLTQLAFYAGWPRVFSAMPVFRAVFESRGLITD